MKPESPIAKAANESRVTSHLDYRDFLQAVYACVKRRLARYSYLQFSADLGFSRSNVIFLVITGKRPLTSKAALKVSESMDLRGVERRYFETLVRYCNARRPDERELLFQELVELKNRTLKSLLERSQLDFFSDWFHPIILEMMRTREFRSDPAWIAAEIRPRIRPEQARRSLELLERLGLASFDAKLRRHRPTRAQVTTGDEVASIAVARYLQHMIDLGKEAITAVAETERDISAVTVCVSDETLARMKTAIQAFRKQLLAMAEDSPDADRVAQVNIQLFPVSGASKRGRRDADD